MTALHRVFSRVVTRDHRCETGQPTQQSQTSRRWLPATNERSIGSKKKPLHSVHPAAEPECHGVIKTPNVKRNKGPPVVPVVRPWTRFLPWTPFLKSFSGRAITCYEPPGKGAVGTSSLRFDRDFLQVSCVRRGSGRAAWRAYVARRFLLSINRPETRTACLL